MSKRGAYLGGSSISHFGDHSHPHGTKVSSATGSPKLTGSRKWPAAVMVTKLVTVKERIQQLIGFIDAGNVRIDCERQIRTIHKILSDFSGKAEDVNVNIRFAYDEGQRLIQKVTPHVKRQLKRSL
jgi:hypothetical protein